MCQDASARAVTRSSGTCALLKGGHRYSWYRRPICIITGPPPSVGDDITRLLQMSTAGPGRTGPNGLTLPPKLTAGAAKPVPAYGGAAACGPPGRPRGRRAVLDAPGRSWGRLGPISPRTTITSSGAPRAWVTLKATGTPPHGRPATTTRSPRRCPNRAARRRPASARSSETHGYPVSGVPLTTPAFPQADSATRADGHLRQAAGCNSKARRMAAVSAEGIGIPALARGPWACTPGTGASATGAAGGTSCRDAPGPSPLGIKAVAARQGGKRSRCSRRSAGTAGAGSGRASRRGEALTTR